MEFKNGSELARASSLCRAQMILLPQLFLLACKLSPDDIAMHASASSCPPAILLGYLLLRIKPKLYFEFGIFAETQWIYQETYGDITKILYKTLQYLFGFSENVFNAASNHQFV